MAQLVLHWRRQLLQKAAAAVAVPLGRAVCLLRPIWDPPRRLALALAVLRAFRALRALRVVTEALAATQLSDHG